jgi:hypothetical protein
MSPERNLGRVALIAGCVVLLSSCGGNEVERSAALFAKDTKVCIQNLSSVTPNVTFIYKDEQSGEGPLKFGATACASGSDSWTNRHDVEVEIDVPAPNVSMEFSASNKTANYPFAILAQYGDRRCFRYSYSEGDSHRWSDGLLKYEVKLEPDDGVKLFRVTIQDEKMKPSVDGKPAKC